MMYTLKVNEEISFQEHVKKASRIFLSGSFGIGKTTFLKNKFNKINGEMSGDYICFHMFPVNYLVAENKDVFELIKYDLLYQIIQYLDNEDIDGNNHIYQTNFAGFVTEKYQDIFYSFIKLLPKIGESIFDIKSEVNLLIKQFEIYVKSNQPDNEHIKDYISEFQVQKGSIYEGDFYTQLILSLLEIIKKKNTAKKTVLIIDDIDRIDPAHLFRLLNVFTAHFDVYSDQTFQNKFDLDKIIIVGDYENIRSIYHHFYGENTDFRGYMDKFISDTIYELKYEDLLSSILFEYYQSLHSRFNGYLSNFCTIISILFKYGFFNLRQFNRVNSIEIAFESFDHIELYKSLELAYNGDINTLIHYLEANKLNFEEQGFNFSLNRHSEYLLSGCCNFGSKNTTYDPKNRDENPVYKYSTTKGVTIEFKMEYTHDFDSYKAKVLNSYEFSVFDYQYLLLDFLKLGKGSSKR